MSFQDAKGSFYFSLVEEVKRQTTNYCKPVPGMSITELHGEKGFYLKKGNSGSFNGW